MHGDKELAGLDRIGDEYCGSDLSSPGRDQRFLIGLDAQTLSVDRIHFYINLLVVSTASRQSGPSRMTDAGRSVEALLRLLYAL